MQELTGRGQKWSGVPLLQRLDKWVTQQVDDPAVRLASVYRKPWVWPLAKLAQVLFFTRWGLDEGYVRAWRAAFSPAPKTSAPAPEPSPLAGREPVLEADRAAA